MRSVTACLSLMLLLGQSSSKEPLPYRSFAGDFERIADSTQRLPMEERVKVFVPLSTSSTRAFTSMPTKQNSTSGSDKP
jgi:hypothetical protein